MRYKRHIFVCVNEREEGHHRGCCKSKGGEEVRGRLKELIKERGLKGECRANSAGCLDTCEFGVTAVVYPEG
ncbi:MAG: ferredoxin, partial [Candidatus Kapaibacterium sp.]